MAASTIINITEKEKVSMEINNNRFIAGGGTLALGIIGTALGGLAAVAQNGGLPLFGGNVRAAEDARIAKLESERYTDAFALKAQERASAQDIEIATIRAELKTAKLEVELEREKSKNALLEATAPLASGLAAVQATISGITKVVIPASAVESAATTAGA